MTFFNPRFITQRNDLHQGFSLFETVAAAMLSFLFVTMGANLVVTANMYKVVAKKNDMMNSLVRSDVESLKYQASKLKCDASTKNNFALTLAVKLAGYQTIAEAASAGYSTTTGEKGATTEDDATTLGEKKLTIKILGNEYKMERTVNIDSTVADYDPDILPINYSFTRVIVPAPTSPLLPDYELNVKVIPNASLNCQ